MSVHRKLMIARVKLQNTELKKTGHNKFAGYYYFELGDFLPQVQNIFYDVGLCGFISFDESIASLTIVDTEDNSSIVITSPMVEANLKGAHPIQNLGAVETYTRRYLWVTAMEIVEHDALDSSAPLKDDKVVITPTQGIADSLPPEEMQYLRELAMELMALDGKQGLEKMEAENLEADQKVALWGLLPSKVRSQIKKAKES
jgi:hypothetical protein